MTQVPSWNYCLVCAVCLWGLFLLVCTYTVLVVIIRPHVWNQDSQSCHRTSRRHWTACWVHVIALQIYLNKTFYLVLLSLMCDDTMMSVIFQLAFLHLQLWSFSTFDSPRNRACDTRPSPLVGGVWARDYGNYASLLAIPVAILALSWKFHSLPKTAKQFSAIVYNYLRIR